MSENDAAARNQVIETSMKHLMDHFGTEAVMAYVGAMRAQQDLELMETMRQLELQELDIASLTGKTGDGQE